MKRRLAVVGNGMAAAALLDWLVRLEAAWAITVLGDEPHPAYDRSALSAVLAGERQDSGLALRDGGWLHRHDIEIHSGCRVLAVSPEARTLRTTRGDIGFDACVLATGSRPAVPPTPGAGLPGVTTFRTLDDVRALIRRPAGPAVVIGGGVLGLETARGLQARGHDVTIVHLVDRLMERQLDRGAAAFLRRELERTGIRVRLAARAERIEGRPQAEAVVLTDGERLPARLVVICAGIRPNVELAVAAGLDIGRGVIVDDRMATSAPGVSAIGECAEHRGVVHGLVGHVREQALVLARRLAGDAAAAFAPGMAATRLGLSGVGVFAGGRTSSEPRDREVVLRDDAAGSYRRLLLRDGVLAGVTLVGDLRSMAAAGDALGRRLGACERRALLGVGDQPLPGTDLRPEAVVCGCNGVTKAAILAAIGRGCATAECIGRATRAAASCGTCSPLVEGLLEASR